MEGEYATSTALMIPRVTRSDVAVPCHTSPSTPSLPLATRIILKPKPTPTPTPITKTHDGVPTTPTLPSTAEVTRRMVTIRASPLSLNSAAINETFRLKNCRTARAPQSITNNAPLASLPLTAMKETGMSLQLIPSPTIMPPTNARRLTIVVRLCKVVQLRVSHLCLTSKRQL